MSSVAINKNGLDTRWSRQNEPVTGLVLVPKPEQPGGQEFDLDHDVSFRSGVRAFYEQLCARHLSSHQPVRSLGLTSCYRGEGRSSVISHLATIAAQNRHVALVDANKPRGQVHAALQELAPRNGAGLRPAFGSPSLKAPRPAAAEGRPTSQPPTIEESRELIRAFSSKFDFTLVDLPPLELPAVLEWAPALDAVVLVVESERVRWQVATRGIELLEQAGSKVLGILLNKQQKYIPQWLYQRL